MDSDKATYLDIACNDIDDLMPVVNEIERTYNIHVYVVTDEERGGVSFVTIKSTGLTPDIIFDMGCKYWA